MLDWVLAEVISAWKAEAVASALNGKAEAVATALPANTHPPDLDNPTGQLPSPICMVAPVVERVNGRGREQVEVPFRLKLMAMEI